MNTSFVRENASDTKIPNYGIRCLTCKMMIFSKKELPKRHRGHDVVYLDKNGEPER